MNVKDPKVSFAKRRREIVGTSCQIPAVTYRGHCISDTATHPVTTHEQPQAAQKMSDNEYSYIVVFILKRHVDKRCD